MKTRRKDYIKKVFFLWLICFFVFLVVYLLLIGPQKNRVERVHKILMETKQVYEKSLAASQKKNQTMYQKKLEKLGKKLHTFVVDTEDTANLTLDISEIANKKNISSFSIEEQGKLADNNSKISGCERITENFIKIAFSADFADFATFLNAMERHRPVVFVDMFEISRSYHDDSKPKAEMELSIFVRKQTSTIVSKTG